MISFDPAKCNSEPLVIDSSPLCKPDCSIDPVKNRTFKSVGLGNSIIEWDMSGLFGGTVTNDNPTTVAPAVPAQTTIALRQTYTNIAPGVYRVYYNVTSSKTDWGFGLQINGETPIAILTNEVDLTKNGFIDVLFQGIFPPDNELVVFFTSVDDTYEFTPHFINLCPVPAFDPLKRYYFQLPMYSVTGDNLINETLGMIQSDTDVHTGTLNYSDTITPFNPNTLFVQSWDFPFIDYPIGYDGALFFKYTVGAASVAWGTDYENNAKTAELLFENSVGGICLTGFTHADPINPAISLSNCFKSELNVGSPITVDDGAICVSGFYEEDTSVQPSDARVDISFEDIEAELYEMNTVVTSFVSDDDKFYRLRFRLNNTTQVTVIFEDSAGTPFFIDVATGVNYDAIIYTGTLPLDKTITVRIQYDNVISCESETFYVDMLTEASLEEYANWEAELQSCEPCDPETIGTIAFSQSSIQVIEGDKYNLNSEYVVLIEDLPPGCYQIQITGAAITDAVKSIYTSQCFKVCDGTFDLCYFEFEFEGQKICIGENVIDFQNYKSSPGKLSNEPHFWLRCDLQELTIDDERNIYRRSDGYSIVSYVQQFSTYVLQLWKMPEYVRRAFAVGAINTFKINGTQFQKLDDEQFAPQFSFDPNTPMRINVRPVGDFALSQNVLNC